MLALQSSSSTGVCGASLVDALALLVWHCERSRESRTENTGQKAGRVIYEVGLNVSVSSWSVRTLLV